MLADSTTGEVVSVLDTKYKRSPDPETDDISQVVAYAVRMQTKNAFLVYPSSVTSPFVLHVGDRTVRGTIFDIGRRSIDILQFLPSRR